jgi:hypothetical protein
MITNPLLEEIYNTQKRMVEDSQYDMKKYTENLQRQVREVEEEYGLKFHYGKIEGGPIDVLKL